MREIKLLFILKLMMLSASCAMTPPEPKIDNLGAIDSIASTSDIQMTIVKSHGDPERYCAARQSDVADTRSVGTSIGVSATSAGESIGESSSQGALALGGRSPAVLIVREMMYRACELSLNLNADNAQTLQIYKMFMDEMKAITSMQIGSGTSSAGQAASSANRPATPQKSTSDGSNSNTGSSSSSSDNVVQGVD